MVLFFCCSPIAAGVAVSGGAEVSVIPWDVGSAPAPADKAVHLVPVVITGVGNSGSYR